MFCAIPLLKPGASFSELFLVRIRWIPAGLLYAHLFLLIEMTGQRL
jgi:hypothetical protein